MASAQCNRICNETCHQKCYGSGSLGQRMSGRASWVKGSSQTGQQAKPSCQAHAHSCPNQGTCKAQTHQACHATAKPQHPQCGVNKASTGHHQTHTHTHSHGHNKHQTTNGASCQCVDKTNCRHSHNHNRATNGGLSCNGKTVMRREQKEKNLFRRIKDRISGNSSCSDSDSDSDHECCHKRKN